MKNLLELGASPDKLVLGVLFGGMTFTLVDRNLHEIGSLSNGRPGWIDMTLHGMRGPYNEEDGFLGYNTVCWV